MKTKLDKLDAASLTAQWLQLRFDISDGSFKKNKLVRSAKAAKMTKIKNILLDRGINKIEIPGSVGYDGEPIKIFLERT